MDARAGATSDNVEDFFRAAAEGAVDELRRMLDADPALAHAVGEYDRTALHAAAEHDHAEAVRVLVHAGADVEAQTSWTMTPLEWAATVGSARAGAVLRDAGAGANLYTAAGLGDLVGVRRHFDDEGHWDGQSSLMMTDKPRGQCARTNRADDREEVVDLAFHIACRNGHTAVARFLEGAGAHIDARGMFGATALHWAALGGHRETVRYLTGRGADIERVDPEFNASPLGWAVEGGHLDVARELMAAGAQAGAQLRRRIAELERGGPD